LSYTRARDHLTRRAGGLNRPAAWPSAQLTASACPDSLPFPALTAADSLSILTIPSTMKGGDPVSFTKRCHLAGIAR